MQGLSKLLTGESFAQIPLYQAGWMYIYIDICV